jgi:preprotein translocase SecE subunit
VAKTRAQRKAERRKRQQQAARQNEKARRDDARAQQATQTPESGEVAEAEAVLRTGGQPEELGETVQPPAEPEVEPEEAGGDGAAPAAPAPSRADVGAPERERAPERESRRERKRREREEARAKEERRRARERKPAEVEERQRGAVVGFLISCWAELKRVQWPDRDTLIQASAVTVLFVAIATAYLGVLDAAFNWLVQRAL